LFVFVITCLWGYAFFLVEKKHLCEFFYSFILFLIQILGASKRVERNLSAGSFKSRRQEGPEVDCCHGGTVRPESCTCWAKVHQLKLAPLCVCVGWVRGGTKINIVKNSCGKLF
jgi:hypothetical protein